MKGKDSKTNEDEMESFEGGIDSATFGGTSDGHTIRVTKGDEERAVIRAVPEYLDTSSFISEYIGEVMFDDVSPNVFPVLSVFFAFRKKGVEVVGGK